MAKSRLISYIRRDGIELYLDGLEQPVYLGFQPEVVKNLEVLNCDLMVSQFLATTEELKVKKADVIFLLADDVLFTKDIVVSEPEKMQAELQAFLDLVPIAPDKRVVGDRASEKTVTHFALNKGLYIFVVQELQRLKYNVLTVVPTYVLNVEIQQAAFGKAPSLSLESLDKVANAALQAKAENLLLQEPKPVVEPKQMAGISVSMQVNDKKKLAITALFVIICIGVLGTALYVSLKPIFVRPKPVLPAAVSPVPEAERVIPPETILPEQTSSPIPTNEVRKALAISIVNASGVPGQAKQVQDALAPLGYLKFTPSNGSPADGQTTTTIQFKSTVPAEINEEIQNAVKGLFPETRIATMSAETNFDIVITTLK